MRHKKYRSTPNLLSQCVFYRDAELPAAVNQPTIQFRQSLIKDSLVDADHPLNQLVQNKRVFVPYINERDAFGKLIVNGDQAKQGQHYKSQSNSQMQLLSHLLGSKNSVSNNCSIVERSQSINKQFRLKNLLGMTLDNTEDQFPSILQSSILDPKMRTSFKFNNNMIGQSYQRRTPASSKDKVRPELKYPQYVNTNIPKTPQAKKLFQSYQVIKKFNENKIPDDKLNVVMLFEKLWDVQKQLLNEQTSKDRRMKHVVVRPKHLKLSMLLLLPRATQTKVLD